MTDSLFNSYDFIPETTSDPLSENAEMTPLVPTVDELLAENERRRMEADAPFDPISGLGSVGERFKLDLPGLGDYPLYLPVSMRSVPEIDRLAEADSFEGFLARELGHAPSQREREAWAARFQRLRSLHDFPFWAASFVYIKTKGGGDDRLFVLNRPQRRFVAELEDMRLANKPIRLILLKARQWGGSTCAQIYMAWLQLVHAKGLNSLIIAHQAVGSDEIKDMFDRMISAYPDRLLFDEGELPKKGEKKTQGVGRSGAMMRVPARNCKIKVGTAERPDSCRGGDYSLVHCSEVGIWKATLGKTPEQILRSACSGVLLRPLTMIVYESTANGTGNFFHREYEAARRGVSQFRSMFVSWFEIEQYSAPLSDSERRAFAERLLAEKDCEAAANERRQPGSYMWWLWEKGATLEALAWYEAERSKYSDHALMAAEYPSDDVEAFVHSGARVFDRYRVESLRGDCCAAPMRGEIDIPGAREFASGIVSDAVRASAIREARFVSLPSGGWQIWKLPEEAAGEKIADRYVTVVDVGGRGVKSDWSVIVVLDRAPMLSGLGPEVVAQWRGHTDFDILAWKAALGASFYDNALLVIESNTLETRDPDRDTDGDQSGFILNRLRDVYPNLYARPGSEEEVRRGMPARYGFHTNVATKPMIIATLVKVIREGLYTERDELCLDEYLSYERRPNGSFGAIAGAHDDLLMTRAIGLHICFHCMDHPHRVSVPAAGRQSPYRPTRRRPGFHSW